MIPVIVYESAADANSMQRCLCRRCMVWVFFWTGVTNNLKMHKIFVEKATF